MFLLVFVLILTFITLSSAEIKNNLTINRSTTKYNEGFHINITLTYEKWDFLGGQGAELSFLKDK